MSQFELGTYEEFIFSRTYARWLEKEQRRESFDEAVDRYSDFFKDVAKPISKEFKVAIEQFRDLNVCPSMRAFFTAGPALRKHNIAGYNCCYLVIDRPKRFSELMFVLMNGTGVGFSVERQVISKLPEVPKLNPSGKIIKFEDSKLGWAEGYNEFVAELYNGNICNYDLSLIRPQGARLKTFGGKASGPDPLELLLKQTLQIFTNASGRSLRSIECHDLCCHIAAAIVVGGVRRSATISLSNLSDDRMRNAKDGEFWMSNPQRSLSNNSVAYTEKPDLNVFLDEWISLMKSGSGERGIFNREACEKIIKKNKRRKPNPNWGCNPCSEILLRPQEFCNLSEVVIRPKDTLEELKEKVTSAVVLGCVQATLTDFEFIDDEYRKNCEEERLLGVSLTGLRDHEILKSVSMQSKKMLKEMKNHAIEVAKSISTKMGFNMPAAITAVKPSGTVSQMVDSSSGIHTRFSPYYIRRVRVNASDAMCKFLIDKGVSHNPEVGETYENVKTMVFDFPIESPKACICNRDVSALDQLYYWKMLQQNWCEHKPSCTVFVDEDEWIEVAAFVYRYWDIMSGVAFLPKSNSIYQLPPYEEITSTQYNELKNNMPDIDFADLEAFEKADETIGAQEYSCSGGSCELI